MNAVFNKVLTGVGVGLVTFIYGAGAASIGLAGREIYSLKKRVKNLEEGLCEAFAATDDNFGILADRIDRLDSRNCALTRRVDIIEDRQFDDYSDIMNAFEDIRKEIRDKNTAKSDEDCTNLEEKNEENDEKKDSKSDKK